jgi:hypothetical protein
MRLTTALLLLALLLTACSGSKGNHATPSDSPTPTTTLTPSIQGVHAFEGLKHDHLTKGQYPQSYPESPPVGGPHSPVWLKCAVYSSTVPKENAVHSMEHGGIWVTYSTDLPAAKVATLAQLTRLNPEYVLVSPYGGQDHPVIVSTWGLQLRVDGADDPRLVAFIQTYAGGNQGGERGVGCATGGATLEQALAFDRSQR